jgi:hypothetical protein
MVAPRIITLTDDELEKSLVKRMKKGLEKISNLKKDWDSNYAIYQVVSSASSTHDMIDARHYLADDNVLVAPEPATCRVASAIINFHSKLVMSEPTVIAESLENDTISRQAEKYVQRYCDDLYRTTAMKPVLDEKVWLDCAIKGIGVLGVEWDPYRGDIAETPKDPEAAIKMTGDHKFYYQRPELFIIDPVATIFEIDADWCIGGEILQIETARWQHPDQIKEILDMAEDDKKAGFGVETADSEPVGVDEKLESVIKWTYYERHMPSNGMRGAKVEFFYGLDDEKVVFLSREPLDNEHGQLPFCVMTDLNTNDCYGLARATLCQVHHDKISRFFQKVEDNIEQFGETRMLMPTGLKANAVEAAGVKIIPFNGTTGEKPIYLTPSAVTGDIWKFNELLGREIDMVFASGEFDRGEINRELSSYAVLTAIERSEAKLILLFSKKKRFIKRLYTLAISDAKQYIQTARTFATSGGLSVASSSSFKGADLKGRVNLTVEFGMYQPIDPAARKQQLFELLKTGAIEKAGLPIKKTVSQLMGGDIKPIKDMADMAEDVQVEELWRMINGEEAPVQPYHEHLTHYAIVAKFMNELQFEHLDVEIKKKIFKHYLDHKAAIEQVLAKQQPQGAPGGAPEGGGGENPLAALMGGAAAGAASGGGTPPPAQGAPTP